MDLVFGEEIKENHTLENGNLVRQMDMEFILGAMVRRNLFLKVLSVLLGDRYEG